MNWSRGFLRSWMAVSILWVIGMLVLHIMMDASIIAGVWVFRLFGHLAQVPTLVIVFAPPAILFVIGIILVWTIKGFRHRH
jgi:hypothetical protein